MCTYGNRYNDLKVHVYRDQLTLTFLHILLVRIGCKVKDIKAKADMLLVEL